LSRVLITGGAGAIGAAVARRLLADPAYDVRVADDRAAPLWMREGCEIRDGDLRAPARALAATKGCSLVVHLATCTAGDGDHRTAPHTLIERENATHAAIVRAAVERDIERFVYISSADVYERSEELPTPESALARCPAPRSLRAFARLCGERYCLAAHDQYGLPYAICRPSAVYGSASGDGEPGEAPLIAALLVSALREERVFELHGSDEATSTPTHVDDVADGIVLALSSTAALDDVFNLAGPAELTAAELAHRACAAAGVDREQLTLRSSVLDEDEDREDAPARRSWPSAQKAYDLLGWRANVALEDGLGALAETLRERKTPSVRAACTAG
jgi:UDP-glucose 4-epimerase